MDATAPEPATQSGAAPDAQTLSYVAEIKVQAESQQLDEQLYSAYFGVFGLGAFLLLLYPFLPRRKKLTWRGFKDESYGGTAAERELAFDRGAAGRVVGVDRVQVAMSGMIIMLILTAISHQTTVDQSRGFINEQNKRLEKELRIAMRKGPEARDELIRENYMYLPQEQSLRYLTLGNMGVAADLLWLSSLQYVSSPFRQGQKFDLLYHFFDNILAADPEWIEIQVAAGRLLSALDPDRKQAEKFYVRALTQNPKVWVIPYEAARHYVVPPSDARRLGEFSRKASVFFEMALERPGMPEEARGEIVHLIGLLKSESGQDAAGAETLFKNANDQKAPPTMRGASARQFLGPESKRRAKDVQDAVADVKKKYGRYPPNLSMLYAGKIPIDAYGLPFDYDAEKGTVTSRGVKLMNMIQYQSVLEGMLGLYEGANQKLPPTLRELSQFIRAYYKRPEDIPFTVQEAFGPYLDCEHSPLGTPWDYNPQTGKVTLPAEVNIQLLMKNAGPVMDGVRPPDFAPPQFLAP